MGSSSGGGGSDSTKLGKIAPPEVSRPYLPHQDVNHALVGNWMQRQMSPHGTTNPAPFSDTQSMIEQGQQGSQRQMLTFQDMLRQLGLPQQSVGGGQAPHAQVGAQPNMALPGAWPRWAPPQIQAPLAVAPPPQPWQPFEINA